MSPTTTETTSAANAARPNIWIGKHTLPDDEQKPKWIECSASFASVFAAAFSVVVLVLSICFNLSTRLTILDEHDRQAQKKFDGYDALVIERTRDLSKMKADMEWMGSDIKWIRERLEKKP
jgi:hypothetical protein